MKPRIFIGSTFYDLKYIREDLANFIRSYGYEPVLFEDGDIGYTPGKTLDSLCYESMRNSDMVILIIGGEYESAASGEKKDEFMEYMGYKANFTFGKSSYLLSSFSLAMCSFNTRLIYWLNDRSSLSANSLISVIISSSREILTFCLYGLFILFTPSSYFIIV